MPSPTSVCAIIIIIIRPCDFTLSLSVERLGGLGELVSCGRSYSAHYRNRRSGAVEVTHETGSQLRPLTRWAPTAVTALLKDVVM